MLDDWPTKDGRVGEGAAQDQGIGDHPATVGEADRAIFGEQAVLGQFLAGQFLGGGGVGVDVDQSYGGGAALNKLQQRDVINHRIGIGQASQCGDAAGDGRAAQGFQRLHVFVARFARIDAHIDQPRHQGVAAAIDGLDVLLDAVDHHMAA